MASKIPSLGPAPTQLTTTEDFHSNSPIFPPDFLPKGTTIKITEEVGGVYMLSWTNGGNRRSIQGLTWDGSLTLLGGLKGENVEITIGDLETIYADVSIAPRGLGSDHTWDGAISVELPNGLGTPTTGTFVAQASSGGYYKLGFVKSIGGHSKDTFPQLGTANPGTHVAR